MTNFDSLGYFKNENKFSNGKWKSFGPFGRNGLLFEDVCVDEYSHASCCTAHSSDEYKILLTHRASHMLRTEQTFVGIFR